MNTVADMIDNFIEAPNVVTEAGFRMLLAEGLQAEIVCLEDAEFRNAVWRGAWSISAINKEETKRFLVVVARANDRRPDEIRVRVWKTAGSLLSFLRKYGADRVTIPFDAGTRALHPPVYDPESGDPLPDWAD